MTTEPFTDFGRDFESWIRRGGTRVGEGSILSKCFFMMMFQRLSCPSQDMPKGCFVAREQL